MPKHLTWTEDQVIHFPNGLPGFEDHKRFIISSEPEHQPFHWLNCIEQDASFALINPLLFKPEYEPRLKKEELVSLHIEDPKELLLYVIVTLRDPLDETTGNLMGPIFINIRERIGKQILLEEGPYSHRERILSPC
jgi:flagellar assembly factor FliW